MLSSCNRYQDEESKNFARIVMGGTGICFIGGSLFKDEYTIFVFYVLSLEIRLLVCDEIEESFFRKKQA